MFMQKNATLKNMKCNNEREFMKGANEKFEKQEIYKLFVGISKLKIVGQKTMKQITYMNQTHA